MVVARCVVVECGVDGCCLKGSLHLADVLIDVATLFVQLFANLLKLLNVDSVFSDSLLVPKIIRIKTLRKQIDGNAGRF